jgi:formylglycine-generating enzyme required for sulfatase activity
MARAAVVAAVVLLAAGAVQATITIDTVLVGNPGNVGELSGAGAGVYGPDRICGSVSYTYNIGKYEVTAGQYTAFLNAVAKTDTYGLYVDNTNNAYGCNINRTGSSGSYVYTVGTGTPQDVTNWANRPVNYVSFWDACRFANWLHNGQPTGLQDASTTEDGAYTLDGYNGYDGRTIQRNANATWAVTSEDEWYKAAYYKGGGTNAGYWDYPTKSNTAPSNVGWDGYTDPGNHANYYYSETTMGYPYYRTNVGEFENSASAYGTFDQGGNVQEWNEAIPYQNPPAYRGLRGGSFFDLYGKYFVSDVKPIFDSAFL